MSITAARREGVSRWREIADTLMREIDHGILGPGDKLLSEANLVERFGAARQTVRRALAHLRDEGLLDVRLGKGTFVAERSVQYKISSSQTFERNLLDNFMSPTRELLLLNIVEASSEIAKKLEICPGSPVLLAETLGSADGVPISLVRNYFPVERMAGIITTFQKISKQKRPIFSLDDLLQNLGFRMCRRRFVRLKSRLASLVESERLDLLPTDHVVETMSTSEGEQGFPIFYSISVYAANRVDFYIDIEGLAKKP